MATAIKKKAAPKKAAPILDLIYEPSIFDLNALNQTEEKRTSAIVSLTNMSKEHGWQIIKAALDVKIKSIDNQFFNSPIGPESELLRRERQWLVLLSNLPKFLIESLVKTDDSVENPDPYA